MTIEKITTNKAYNDLLPSGNRLVKSIIPDVPQIATYRYWRLTKTNAPADFHYHTEIEWSLNSVNASLTAGMISQSGYVVYANENFIDGNIATYWGHSFTTSIGSYIQFDFGAGNEQAFDKVRLYIVPDAAVTQDAPIYNVLRSHDGIIWNIAATGLDCAGAAGWKEITWTAT